MYLHREQPQHSSTCDGSCGSMAGLLLGAACQCCEPSLRHCVASWLRFGRAGAIINTRGPVQFKPSPELTQLPVQARTPCVRTASLSSTHSPGLVKVSCCAWSSHQLPKGWSLLALLATEMTEKRLCASKGRAVEICIYSIRADEHMASPQLSGLNVCRGAAQACTKSLKLPVARLQGAARLCHVACRVAAPCNTAQSHSSLQRTRPGPAWVCTALGFAVPS